MPISSKQIRAARGLLNLSQKELAGKADLSVNSLNNIEREVGSPRNDSFQAIEDALVKEGVEFLDKDGVRLAGEQLEIEKIDGPNFLNVYYEDFLKAFPHGNGEVLIIGKDNKRFDHFALERLLAYKRFEAVAMKNNIRERALFLENDTHFLSMRNHYRWVPKELFGTVPVAIYGDNVSIILWGPPARMIIIRNPGIAQTFRHHFELAWSMAKPVPDDVHKFHYETKAQKILEQAKKDGLIKDAPPPKTAKKARK
ncbi:MAG: helix-turn-helix transcriptional regulator [Proteobacteria bacterium]|nr:helix-turn-helix transcriptional regulator [Pseudomonadota bacterium]